MKERQRQAAKEEKRKTYDNQWTAANEQQHRQQPAEQQNNRGPNKTASSESRGRGEDERQTASRGRANGYSGDRRSSASKQRNNTPVPMRGHRRGLNVAPRREERMEEEEDDYVIRRDEEEMDDFTDRPSRGQQRSSSSFAASSRKHTSSRTASSRPHWSEQSTEDSTVDTRSKPSRNNEHRTRLTSPKSRHQPAYSDSSLPLSPSASRHSPSLPDSSTNKPLPFDGQTYSMQLAAHLSEQMAESYQRLSSETGLPIVPLPLSSSVALLVSPTGRLYMRWGGKAGRKSTHAVQAGFMLRAARKSYERGEAVKDLPLVRALAHALPSGKLLDPPTSDSDKATGERSKRSSTQHYVDGLTVMDATAGLCRDAAVPLFAGAEVYAVERNPAVYALVRFDIDRRLNEPSVARERLNRLHPILGDSLLIMRAMAAGKSNAGVPVPDVIMIDVWTDDNSHVDEFKARQIARMLRHIDTPTRPNDSNKHVSAHRASSGDRHQTEEEDTAADVPSVARREQLQQRESLLLAEARRAAKRCVVVKRLKSASSKSELLGAERTTGALAVYRGGMFEYVVYSARNERWDANNAAVEAAERVLVDGIDPVVDTSVDAAIGVAEQRRDA